MKVLKTLCMVNLGLIMLFSCKKGDPGLQGETGPKGEQGEKGAAGVQGSKGADGATIFSGDGVPAVTLGQNGDYYIRKSTSEMYGPKTDAGWGKATSFKGATGANGANGTNGTNGAAGTKILSGTAIPAVSLGAIGDFYFKTDSYQLFGPKIASGWGAGINLKGATGSANVIYSGWQFAKVFKDSTIDNTLVKIGHVPARGLTASIVQSGAVLMFMDYGGGSFPLPYTSFAGGRANTVSFIPKTNQIIVYRATHDGSGLVNLSSLLQYRYVLIPGGVMASLKRQGIDLNDFSTVEMALKAE